MLHKHTVGNGFSTDGNQTMQLVWPIFMHKLRRRSNMPLIDHLLMLQDRVAGVYGGQQLES